jgi:hypothetical protein
MCLKALKEAGDLLIQNSLLNFPRSFFVHQCGKDVKVAILLNCPHSYVSAKHGKSRFSDLCMQHNVSHYDMSI